MLVGFRSLTTIGIFLFCTLLILVFAVKALYEGGLYVIFSFRNCLTKGGECIFFKPEDLRPIF